MTNKHQNDVIDAVDFMRASFGTEKHQEIQRELAEVYRKAEAFDTLLHTYERYKHSHAHDLKLLLGMKVIELLEADE